MPEARRTGWRSGSKFYALLTFVAWLLTGIASVRWPSSALAGEFHAMSVLLAIMLREAMSRSQNYFTNRERERERDKAVKGRVGESTDA